MNTEDRNRLNINQNADSMRRVALAVIGTPRSGKSTFVQHALDLKKLPTSRVSAKKVSLEGVVSVLRVHEVDAHEIEVASDGTLHWPLVDDGGSTGKIDGVLVIYSTSDVGSTKPLPALIREFKNAIMLPMQH